MMPEEKVIPSINPPYKHLLSLLLFMALALLAGPALVDTGPALAQDQSEPEVDSSGAIIGREPEGPAPAHTSRTTTNVSILCYSTASTGVCGRVESIFGTVTSIGSLDVFPANLAQYDVVYVGYGEGTALDSKATQLQNYVNAGGGLVVTQPDLEGDISIFPSGFEMVVDDIWVTGARDVEFTPAGAAHPILAGLAADDISGNFESVPLDQVGPGWTTLVKAVDRPLLALAVGQYGSGRMAFHTGNVGTISSDGGSDPYLRQLIEWTGAAAVPTGPDMEIETIEVTQAVQDLDNSVTLIAGKRTYVRVHVSAPSAVYDVFANLSATRGSTRLFPTLAPGNPGADITVRSFPDRGQINDSFWFELPSSWTTAGDLTLTATLDPAVAEGDPNRANNTESVGVTFEQTPPLRLRLFDVRYTDGGTSYQAGDTHLDSLESWLERAYPIANLQSTRHTFTYPRDGLPDVDRLHGYLALGKLLNILFNGEDTRIVYYGMVDDGADFMRGKALDIPSTIAAGPAGTPRTDVFPWDDDSSYADWYGGHELAHTQGRYHAEYCGAAAGVPYPYTGGDISPDTNGSDELYGFDIQDRRIYDPNWHDVMTYCRDQWISDYTYEGIRDHLVAEGRAPTVQASQFVVVVASVDLETKTGSIDDLYVLDEEGDAPLPESGDWTLLLLDADGNELASYAVAARELTDGEEEPGRPGFVNAVVPGEDGLHRVELRYDDDLVGAREMSDNPPTVTITAPQDGAEFSAGPITFSWEGSDADGDQLTYSVFYSHDDGNSWNPLGTGLPTEELTIDSDNLPGGVSRLRVVANDGMRTGSDTTGSFYPSGHAPDVEIVSPADGDTFWPAQLVVFNADVDDLEEGTVAGDSVVWTSDIDGELGTGHQLSTVNLSTGVHTITAKATDGSNRSGQDQITVEVVTGDVPEPLLLEVAPDSISHTAVEGDTTPTAYTATIRSTLGMTLTWSLAGDADWLTISPTSGETPASAVFTIDPSGKAAGDYQALVAVTAPAADNSPEEIPVLLTVEPAPPMLELFLPTVTR